MTLSKTQTHSTEAQQPPVTDKLTVAGIPSPSGWAIQDSLTHLALSSIVQGGHKDVTHYHLDAPDEERSNTKPDDLRKEVFNTKRVRDVRYYSETQEGLVRE